jgi:hypothetical protein
MHRRDHTMKAPAEIWAVALAVLGVSLEVTILFAHGASEATRHDVHGAAFGLIMGAVGAFKGYSASKDSPAPEVNSKAGNE